MWGRVCAVKIPTELRTVNIYVLNRLLERPINSMDRPVHSTKNLVNGNEAHLLDERLGFGPAGLLVFLSPFMLIHIKYRCAFSSNLSRIFNRALSLHLNKIFKTLSIQRSTVTELFRSVAAHLSYVGGTLAGHSGVNSSFSLTHSKSAEVYFTIPHHHPLHDVVFFCINSDPKSAGKSPAGAGSELRWLWALPATDKRLSGYSDARVGPHILKHLLLQTWHLWRGRVSSNNSALWILVV